MSRATALERAHITIRAEHGDLDLRDGLLVITKHGVAHSAVRIPVDRIRSTALVPARPGRQGWLHVNAVGGSPPPTGDLVAMTDPYTVRITRRAAGAAKRFARLVHEHLLARGLPSEPDLAAAAPQDGRYSSSVVVTAYGTDPASLDDAAPEEAASPPTDAVAANGSSPRARQLQQLAELHAVGALTDEEFTQVRARLLR